MSKEVGRGLTNFIDGSSGSGPILSNLALYPSAELSATNTCNQLYPPPLGGSGSYFEDLDHFSSARFEGGWKDPRGGGSNSSTSCPSPLSFSTQISTALLQAGLVCPSASWPRTSPTSTTRVEWWTYLHRPLVDEISNLHLFLHLQCLLFPRNREYSLSDHIPLFSLLLGYAVHRPSSEN